MNNDLLQRLMAAQTDEERSWIATESLLESLPEDVASALWAVAIPHWFDANILAALCPELADRADEIYRQLQTISCVEVFPDRGYNVHELTRNQLLDRLWENSVERFRELSGRAAAYFIHNDKPENQIEWIYHLVIADPDRGVEKLSDIAQRFDYTFCREEQASLVFNLNQQLYAKRLTIKVTIELIFWDGRFKFRSYKLKECLENCRIIVDFLIEIRKLLIIRIDILTELFSLSSCCVRLLFRSGSLMNFMRNNLNIAIVIERNLANINRLQGDLSFILEDNDESLDFYTKALDSYFAVKTPLIASTLKSIGDTLVRLNSYNESLESYNKSLDSFQENNDLLGQAITLSSIANVLQILGQKEKSLENYEAALVLYKNAGNHLEEASVLGKIGELLNLLERRLESLKKYKLALEIFRNHNNQLMIAYTLQSIGSVLMFMNRHLEALEMYESSIAVFNELNDTNSFSKLFISNNLFFIGSSLQSLSRYTNALDKYNEALICYSEIEDNNEQLGNFILNGKVNTLLSMAGILYKLNRLKDSSGKYESALRITRQLDDKLREAYILQNLAILKRDAVIGLTYSKAALCIYEKLDDKINQAINLSYFTSVMQIKLGQKREALISLTRATELAKIQNDKAILEYANKNIVKISRELKGIWGCFDWVKSKLWKE